MSGDEGRRPIPNQLESTNPLCNRVLAGLSPEEFARFEPELETVPLAFGEVIYQFKAPIEHIYFPEPGVLSMVGIAGDENLIEVGLFGREGLSVVGGLTVIDRSQLETSACECYRDDESTH